MPKSPTFLGYFCKGFKIYHFLVKSFLGKFYRDLATFLVTLEINVIGPTVLHNFLGLSYTPQLNIWAHTAFTSFYQSAQCAKYIEHKVG